MKISIAALGSCVSRDPFNSLFNPSYKDFFRVDAYQFQMSIISLMANPIAYQSEDYQFESKVSENSDWHFRTELNKRFLADLVAASPDYLIMDFYTDILFGVIQVGDSYISNKANVFSKNKLWNKLEFGKEFNIQQSFRKYFKLFKCAVDEFMTFKNQYLPDTKVVINKARFTNEYWDDVKKEIVTFGNKIPGHYDVLNRCWNELDNYVIDSYQAEYLQYDKKYYADPNYRFGGLHTVHYKNNFYEDFQLKLLAIVFRDLTEKKLDLEREKSYDGNLVQNGDFHLSSASWKIFRKNVFRVVDGKVFVSSQGNTENQWNQMVSDAIENPETQNSYHLEFTIQLDMAMLDAFEPDDALLKVRTFKKRDQFKAADALQEINITKNELLQMLPSGSGRYTTDIDLIGRYIKIIPYLRKNGAYQMTDFWLSKA